MDPSELQTDGRYNHTVQVQERLNFLRYWYSNRIWLEVLLCSEILLLIKSLICVSI